jgi:DNA polymerase-1
MSEEKLLLVDGSSYLYRAYHALPDLRSPSGQPTGAIYGVLTMLQKLIKEEQPDYLAVIFDRPEKTFRHEIFPEYKANRQTTPEDLISQIKPLHRAIKDLGLPLIAQAGVEADDIIGTLAIAAEKKKISVLIATGDKDMAQLVSNKILMIDSMKEARLGPDEVKEKFGIGPELIIDYLTLAGDASDNIPGVEKVGPKTAIKWLSEYGNLQGIIDHAEQISGKVGENLRASLDRLGLYKQLVTIDCQVELEESLSELVISESNDHSLYEQFHDLGLHRLIKQFQITSNEEPTKREVNYETVMSKSQLDDLIEMILSSDAVAIDTETTSLNYIDAELVGISVSTKANKGFYIPLTHNYEDAPKQLDRDYVLGKLQPWLEDNDSIKVGHNLKYDRHIFATYNISLRGQIYDTMVLSYVYNSTATRHNLVAVSKRYLNVSPTSYEDVAGKGAKQIPFNKVKIEDASYYAAEDADLSFQLYEKFSSLVKDQSELIDLYLNIEQSLIKVLGDIERAGVLIDSKLLDKQSIEFNQTLEEIEKNVFLAAEEEFNLSSPKQLQEILFEKLGLPVLRKTPKGQPSTSESVLQELAVDFPIVEDILDFRTISKLKTTYTDKLPKMINQSTGRVHTSYHQAVTATGRLSSSDPNLQNIPIRTKAGRRIREAFIAPPGSKLLAADYSQIELRIMAHISKDKGLLASFQNELDIHSSTAAEIFSINIDEVSNDQRRSAKAINFGLIYGMSAFGLSKQLNITRYEAQDYIDLYFARYPGVKKYMEETKTKAREKGFVETVFGRRLYLPDIDSSNYQRRQYAERSAINAPMQGTAADLIKKAMVKLHKEIIKQSLQATIIMQVHDELVLEVLNDDVSEITELTEDVMSNIARLDINLKVDIGVGDNWEQAH